MANNSAKTACLQVLNRTWKSPTLTTWGSLIVRSLSVVVVLPLVLTHFSTEEIILWYLFATMMSLQLIADMGFGITFARVIAYAMGGADSLEGYMSIHKAAASGTPNWETLTKLCSTMNRIYLRIALIWLLLLAGIGTWFVLKPIGQNQGHLQEGWMAWIIVILTSTVRMYGNQYTAYLIGSNRISLLRRWETLIWLISIVANTAVLLFGGGLLELVIATQSLMVANTFINCWLFRISAREFLRSPEVKKFDRKVFLEIWPNAWRSGLGTIVGTGLLASTGIFYAQVGSKESVAAYLLALYLIRAVNQFSQAPFYTKIPVLSRLRVEGLLEKQQRLAARGMRWSFCTLVVGIVVLGVFVPPLLKCVGSNVNFVSLGLWALMGMAAFFERYGAMHVQLYTTTNHIIIHIANGVSGLFFIVAVALSYKFLGIYTFPISHIVSNLAFYDWYAAKHSYDAFHLRFWDFERRTTLVPLAILLLYFYTMTLMSRP